MVFPGEKNHYFSFGASNYSKSIILTISSDYPGNWQSLTMKKRVLQCPIKVFFED